METAIRVAETYRAEVATILQEGLQMEAKDAAQLLADGRVDKGEFYPYRQRLGVFPAASLLSATPASRLFDDTFFQKAGLDEDLFVDLYDDSFDDAAVKGGRGDSIDSPEEVGALRELIRGFVKMRRAELLDDIRTLMAKRSAALIRESNVRVRCGDDHIVHVKVIATGPFPIEPLKEVFYDRATTLLPKLARRLFVRNDRVVLQEPSGLAAEDLIRGGFTVHSEIYAKVIPNREAYVHTTVRPEKTPDGLKQYVISMQQLSAKQERGYGLPGLDHEMGSLTGTITLTELADGGTQVEMQVDANPDVMIPDFLISSFSMGVPGQLLDAARAVARHVSLVTYFKCLEKRKSCN